MRNMGGVIKALNNCNSVKKRLTNNEVVVNLAVARGPVGRDDGASNQLEPTGRDELTRSEVPVSTDNPGTTDGSKLGGNGV